MLEIMLSIMPKLKEQELLKHKNVGSLSQRISDKTGNYSSSSPRAKIYDIDFKTLSNKFEDILSKRKKRRLKNRKEVFNFMYKYNELIEEGIIKICKGRYENPSIMQNETTSSIDDTVELCMYFCPYSKSTLWLIIDVLNHQDYNLSREYLIKALDGISSAIQMQKNKEEHYLANVGGTGMNSESLEKLVLVLPPYLPPIDEEQHKYTLVLDLDETLVHYFQTEEEGKCLVRPDAEEFLAEMCKYYEVVIFTAAMQDYADWVIDQIDPNG
jgi:hypothetical protein